MRRLLYVFRLMIKALVYSVGLSILAAFVILANSAWEAYRTLLFPVNVTFYVLDKRNDVNFAEDLRRLFPDSEQRRSRIQITVLSIDQEAVSFTESQWQQALKRASSGSGTEMMFFQLSAPTSESKKILRSKIDMQFSGAARSDVLLRTIALVGAHGETPSTACKQLDADWTHTDWAFGGIGLIVDDHTLALIGPCLKNILANVLGSAA